MDICVIGGKKYDVIIDAVDESFEKLYTADTGRTMGNGALMNLSCIGTFYSHKVTVSRKAGHFEDFDELYNVLAYPRNEGLPVKMVHGQTSIEYEAYVSKGSRALQRADTSNGVVYWKSMTFTLTPMKAQVTV